MQRVERQRQTPTFLCAWVDPDDPQKRQQSCGAMIPFKPLGACSACGRPQTRRFAPRPPVDAEILRSSAVVVDADTQEVVAAQITGHERLASEIAQQLHHVQWQGDPRVNGGEARLSGIVVAHNTFGFTAPVQLRRRFGCSRSRFDTDNPQIATNLYRFAQQANEAFARFAPGAYRRTVAAVDNLIAPVWRLPGSPWTSGVINNTAALPYHRDSGNVRGSWSVMLGCRNDVSGGLLHLRDYDVYLAIPHGSLTMFDGQSLVHGVTPLEPTSLAAWRYTIVAYAKTTMRHCCSDPADEAERAAKRATEASDRRRSK